MVEEERLLQPERLERIRELLEQKNTVKVSQLSRLCKVSENTIRRDLVELENQGFCRRSKGGATKRPVSEHTSFEKRHGILSDCKHTIARKAAGLVTSGHTVIIDSGTTAACLAEQLAGSSHITVITASLAAANILSGKSDITLIMPGGILNPLSGSLTGTPAEQFFSSIHADILFLAVKAISAESGLTDHNIAETSVKQSMIRCSRKVVILADHSKIGRSALSWIADTDAADMLITDSKSDPTQLEEFRKLGIEVIIG
jgi:DeoR family fructose operon transcriptional repressor